jgi:TRAP-type C4-dicarboxylate transport system permease large subunit
MAAALQQGMIEAVPAPPLIAFALMWYTSTPYMLDLGLAPLGLLLPLILYAIVAQTSIENLFIGGILPGLVLVSLTARWGVREALHEGIPRTAFRRSGVLAALWQGKWEALLPVVVLTAFLGGYATIVETSALAAL